MTSQKDKIKVMMLPNTKKNEKKVKLFDIQRMFRLTKVTMP